MNARRISTTIVALVATLALAMMFATETQATNGYFSHGYSAQSKSLAGAGTAFPMTSLAASSNPAGMVTLGTRYDLSIGLFNPNRQYTVEGNPSGFPNTFPLTPGTIESDSKVFFIPSLGANWMINDLSSIGVSIYGNGGMNTDYDTKTYDNPMAPVTSPTGVNLMQLFTAVTYARKLNENHSVGITGVLAYQRFEVKGLQAFGGFSADPTSLSNNDVAGSTGFGARVGYLGELFEGFSLGASYQTKMSMSEFDEYAGLFAEQGDFDIPSSWSVGVAVETSPVLTLVADVQQIMYSEVNSVANPFVPADFNAGILLGDDNAAGFGWEDMTVFKFGMQWEGIADLPLRVGYSYGEQPIPESEMMFNILAPGVIEQHITFGFSRKLCGHKELSFAVTRALSSSVNGPNPMEAPGQQDIELKMDQWDFVVGFSF